MMKRTVQCVDHPVLRARRARFVRGATLIEILITVVVLGLMGSLVIPAMSQTGVLRIQAAVRTLVADITFVQSDALAYQTRRAIWFGKVPTWNVGEEKWEYVDGNGYTVAEVNGPVLNLDTDVLPDPEYPNRPFARNFTNSRFGGAILSNVNFNGDVLLIFDELGGPVADLTGPTAGNGGQLNIVGPDSTFQVTVGAYTGRVTVEELGD